MPSKGGATIPKGGNMPSEGGVLTAEGGMAPSEGGIMHLEDGIIPTILGRYDSGGRQHVFGGRRVNHRGRQGRRRRGAGGGVGPDNRTFENLGRSTPPPPRFENEVAKIRCFFPIFRVFWGRLATLPTIRPPPPLKNPWRRPWRAACDTFGVRYYTFGRRH